MHSGSRTAKNWLVYIRAFSHANPFLRLEIWGVVKAQITYSVIPNHLKLNGSCMQQQYLGMQMTMYCSYTPEPPCCSSLVQHWFMHTHRATAYTFSHRETQNLTFVCTETLVCTQNTQSSFLVYTHTHTPHWTNTI
jgi:hypothetical protein